MTTQLAPHDSGDAVPMDPEIDRVRRLARLLDHYFVDPILGLLVPGAGDVIGSLLGVYIVLIAVKRKHSPVVISRMLLNLALDAVLGVVPLLGDALDFGVMANARNVNLLIERDGDGGRARPRDWLILLGAAALFAGALALTIYAVVALVRALT